MPVPTIDTRVGKNYNLLVYENDSAAFAIDVTQNDGVTGVDISAWALKMQVKKKLGGDIVSDFGMVAGNGFSLTTSPVVGGATVCRINFKGKIPAFGNTLVYDLQATVSGDTFTYLWGNVISTQEVTTP